MALVSTVGVTMKDKKNSKPPKHWTQNVQECTVQLANDGRMHFAVGGGAENGEFPYIIDIRSDKIILETGKLHVDDILLELNGHKLAGYTLWDLKSLINHLGKEPLHFKTLKAGQNLPKDLRRYLGMRMPKGSADHDLQQTIRENLYVRTVPCTTRQPKEGEVDDVDYKFLSVNDFLALEKSGHLLESGIFGGNHYGTPKPPKEPPPDTPVSSPTEDTPTATPTATPTQPQQNNSSSNNPVEPSPASSNKHIRPGANPSAPGKRLRNKSTIEATTLNPKPVDPVEEQNLEDVKKLEEELGTLAPEWEIAFTEQGDMYYIDHHNQRTQWLDPRLEKKKKHTSPDSSKEELPSGWEKIDDPQYGVYYIDHVNRKTQYESPAKMDAKRQDSPRDRPGDHTGRRSVPESPATPRKPSNQPDITKQHNNIQAGALSGPADRDDPRFKFTNNPAELIGQRYTTYLVKGQQGFGFTIIGGDDPNEFLQIRSISPSGPAHDDRVLQTGDVLVAVNKKLVLGCTHDDVVTIFQGINFGDRVEIEVCRGYPLPFDPADPKAHIVTSYAIESSKGAKQNGLGSKSTSLGNIRDDDMKVSNHNGQGREGRSSFSSGNHPYSPPNQRRPSGPAARRGDTNLSKMPHVKSLPDLTHKQQGGGAGGEHHPATPQQQRSKTPTPSMGHPQGYRQRPSQMNDRTSLSSESMEPGYGETHNIVFVKGNQGFGFTVADSPQGQKVKQILAPQRCKTLREGDLLLQINHEPISALPHNEVVQKLKDCPQGQETIITVRRGGLLKPVRALNKLNKSQRENSFPESLRREDERFNDLNGGRQDDLEEDQVSVDSDQKRKNDIMVGEMKNELRNKRSASNAQDKKVLNGPNDKPSNNQDWDSGSDRHSDRDHLYPDWEVEKYNSNKDWHRGQTLPDPKRSQPWMDRPHSRAEFNRAPPERLNSESVARPQSSRPDQGGRYLNGDWSGSLDRRRPPEHRRGVDPLLVGEYDKRGRPRDGPPYRRDPSRDPSRDSSRDPSRDPSREPSEADLSPDMRRHGPADRQRRMPDNRRRFEQDRRGPPRQRHPSQGGPLEERYFESTVFLKTRDNAGFGFRIIGGHEEGSQVTIGAITPGGVAAQDNRLLSGDELLYVDGQAVVGASHKKVVSLMKSAGAAGRVSLGIRRRAIGQDQPGPGVGPGPASGPGPQISPKSAPNSPKKHPYDVTLHRQDNEGFGFVILSSTIKSGSNIGRIVDGSPADRCRDLEVGDRIVAINSIDIRSMHHKDIVNMIKDTGNSVTLTIGSRGGEEPSSRTLPPKNAGHMVNALAMPAQIKGSDASLRPHPGQNIPNHLQPASSADNRHMEPIYAKSAKRKPEPDRLRSQPARPPSAPPQSMTYRDGPILTGPPRAGSPPMGKPLRGVPRQQQPPHPDRGMGRDLDAVWGGGAVQRPPPQRNAMPPHPQGGYNQPPPTGYPQDRRQMGPGGPGSHPTSPPVERRGQPPQRGDLKPGNYYSVDLQKGATGYGFRLRGGREYNNTPLFVLRMADNGPASRSILMRIGDELMEINGQSTEGMLHSEAIDAIRGGGDNLNLVLRRSYKTATLDPRTSQTPSPMFRNMPMTVSSSSLQSDDTQLREGGAGGGGRVGGPRAGPRARAKDHFDNSWNYRSLPRGMKY